MCPGSGIMDAIELGMDGVALFLLFAKPGKEWFKLPAPPGVGK